MNNKLMWGVVVLILIIAGCWYYFSKTEVSDSRSVKIGGMFGLTGYVAFAGEASRNGFIMALEDSGLNPKDYVIEDDHSNLTTAASVAQKLISTDKAQIVIGPEWAEFAQVVTPIATDNKTIFISPWMSGEGPLVQSPYYFSMTPSERGQVKAVLDYMAAHGIQKIALISSNNAWSIGLREIVVDEISHDYPQIKVVFESKPDQDSTDYRTDLAKIAAVHVDGVYALTATSQTGEALARQYHQLGITAPLFMPNSAATSMQADTSADQSINGILFPAWKDYPRTAEFNQKYKARFGAEPAALSAATTYDATMLVIKAIKAGAKTPEEVAHYIQGVKNYEGYSALLNFNGTNQAASQPVEIRQVQGANYTVVK